MNKRKSFLLQILEDDPRNQKSGDHKEYIDSDKAAVKRAGRCVEADHRKHRNRAETVYVRAI
jgi:hypothetical protein